MRFESQQWRMPIVLLDKLHEEPSVGGKRRIPADIKQKLLIRVLNLY